ncbi:MAG: patatin-like phospholipase family protein [Omnitrophica WOR_2 bacterium]
MGVQNRKRVGIALGGGVVRGMAHIGVLSVLQEANIPVDMVAGTSAGSLIGALFSSGMSTVTIRELGEHLRWWKLLRFVFPAQGFFSFDPLRDWIHNKLGIHNFSDLKIPLGVVATDIQTGNPVEFTSGLVAPAVQASCSVPGFITPVNFEGKLLCDGSLADTVPVSLLRRMGADFVIGVDIFSSAIYPRMGPLGMGLTGIEILVQRAGGGITSSDCLITPKLSGYSYFRFSKRELFYQLGREATLAVLPQIRAALNI